VRRRPVHPSTAIDPSSAAIQLSIRRNSQQPANERTYQSTPQPRPAEPCRIFSHRHPSQKEKRKKRKGGKKKAKRTERGGGRRKKREKEKKRKRRCWWCQWYVVCAGVCNHLLPTDTLHSVIFRASGEVGKQVSTYSRYLGWVQVPRQCFADDRPHSYVLCAHPYGSRSRCLPAYIPPRRLPSKHIPTVTTLLLFFL